MKQEEFKARRKRLHKIYLDHDIVEFRKFLQDVSVDHPVAGKYSDSTDEELSMFMYSAKSALLYLGDEWQEARNKLRMRMFEYTEDATAICATCKYFREAPEGEADPCMRMGATPADIACPGFQEK